MKKILNIGSLNNDYVYDVPHFVQPGETLHATLLQQYPGGKGLNQSIALARAGCSIYHAGCIGSDGIVLKDFLHESGVNVEFLRKIDIQTGHAIIQVTPEGQNNIILYEGANKRLDRNLIDSAFEFFGSGDYLILQNEINDIPYIIDNARKLGMTVVINPSPFHGDVMSYPLDLIDVFLLNEVEAEMMTGEKDIDKMLQQMTNQFPKAEIVLTLGEKGVRYSYRNERHSHGIYDVKVVDTTAAGDAFTGYYISSRIADDTVPEALRLASVASALTISKKGAASSIPLKNDVVNANLKSMPFQDS